MHRHPRVLWIDVFDEARLLAVDVLLLAHVGLDEGGEAEEGDDGEDSVHAHLAQLGVP